MRKLKTSAILTRFIDAPGTEPTVDGRAEPVRRFEYGPDDDLAILVVEAVADVSGTPAAEIGPFNDVLDPEALSDLFAPKRTDSDREGGIVAFRLDGYRVEIDGTDREIYVYD